MQARAGSTLQPDWPLARVATPTLYHGTNAVLQPGDEIHSAAFMQGAGMDVPAHVDADYYSSDQIYLTTEPYLAERYAVGTAGRHGGEPHVYEVRPIGYAGPDPEYLESGFGSDQHVATMGEVVREIPLPGIVHWDPETNSMMRGAKTGTVIPGWSFAKVADDHPDGVMVALVPPESVRGALEQSDGESVEQMHVTICYVGKLSKLNMDDVQAAVEEYIATAPQLEGCVGGFGVFEASETSDNKQVLVALMDIPHLDEWRVGLLKTLRAHDIEPPDNHGFTPHCTLAYTDDPKIPDMPEGAKGNFTIDQVLYSAGADDTYYALDPDEKLAKVADKVDDAAELLPGGGFTLSLHGNVPRWGWMVSLGGTEEQFDFPPSRAELQGYIDKWAAELAPSNRYWGGERRGGTVNIDVSECIDDPDEAMAYGREQGQERIYNLGSGQYIKLTGAKGQVTTRFYIHTDTPVDEVESFIKSLPEDEIVERNESLFAVGVPPSGSDLVREFAVTPAGDDFFAGEADDISRSYRDLPINDPNVDPLWKELGELCRAQADALRVTMDIQVVTDHDPYANAAQMHADMDKGVYQVTTLHSDHPVWDVDTNVAFRIAHDVLGHGVAYSDFSFRGEVEAYQAQCGVTPRRLWPVLFTEIIAQSAYANTHHLFGEQKVGLIPLTQEEINEQVGKVMDAPDPAYDATHRSAKLSPRAGRRIPDWPLARVAVNVEEAIDAWFGDLSMEITEAAVGLTGTPTGWSGGGGSSDDVAMASAVMDAVDRSAPIGRESYSGHVGVHARTGNTFEIPLMATGPREMAEGFGTNMGNDPLGVLYVFDASTRGLERGGQWAISGRFEVTSQEGTEVHLSYQGPLSHRSAKTATSYTFDVDFVKDLDQLKDGVTADGTHRVTVEAETWPEAETLAAQIVGSTQGVPTATRRVR